jgi:predicted DsbA family dithiol-disulfide isomerase
VRKQGALIANLAIVAFVGYALLRPAGPVGAKISSWQRRAAEHEWIERNWSSLSSGSRLDVSDRSVQLVSFVDYECKICRDQHPVLDELIANGAVDGIAVRYYPLSRYARSEGAVSASICAARQGRFRQMHDVLFSSDEWITDANWSREAERAGVENISAFESCLSDSTTTAEIERDRAFATALGIRATPSFVHQHRGVLIGRLADSLLVVLGATSRGEREARR